MSKIYSNFLGCLLSLLFVSEYGYSVAEDAALKKTACDDSLISPFTCSSCKKNFVNRVEAKDIEIRSLIVSASDPSLNGRESLILLSKILRFARWCSTLRCCGNQICSKCLLKSQKEDKGCPFCGCIPVHVNASVNGLNIPVLLPWIIEFTPKKMIFDVESDVFLTCDEANEVVRKIRKYNKDFHYKLVDSKIQSVFVELIYEVLKKRQHQ